MSYFISVFLGTFVLEDLALASGIALMADGKMSFMTAFWACFLGISIGDVGLYLIGYLVSIFGAEKRFSFFKKYHSTFYNMRNSKTLTYSIVISRILPGTRFITYVGAGFLRYPFLKFTLLTLASVFLWVLVALSGGKTLTLLFMDHWLWVVILFLIALHLLKTLLPQLIHPWQRKALLHSWRKWTHFEFWPAWFFYIPIAGYYIYFSMKHRSFLMPFYANPNVANAGLLGESKWDFLKYLNTNDLTTLKTLKIADSVDFLQLMQTLQKENFKYPFIVKPDVGQRGFAVRRVKNDFELTDYLLLSHFELIIQKLSLLPKEAGIFYIRQPKEDHGMVFSITDKIFPFVVGDGKTKLGDLIIKDQRARVIAATYFERLSEKLDTVPSVNEIIYLSECGNHCQGAIFKNGNHLMSKALTSEIERIAQQIPDFYFGRFDVRYLDQESLVNGKNFEIVEVNGAGAEATHIWDANTKLIDAYKTLFIQWGYLFEIGAQLRTRNPHLKIKLFSFLKECARVYFRKEKLSISS